MKLRDITIIISVLMIDLATKITVQTSLELHRQIPIIENFFYITYAKNTGAAWSMLSGRQFFLVAISIVGIIMFLYMYFKTPVQDKFGKVCISLMIAGAAGNLIDRATLGYVRDFLDFVIFGYDFPIFNVADMALCIGIVLLLVQTLLKKDEVNGKN